jgi:ATP/ADP translocase/HEAT repeat protein
LGPAAQQIKKFIGNLLRIQSGEGPKTGLMFGILMCVVGSFITGRVARDSLFLSRYSVDYLPYLYIWVAFGVSIQSYLYSRIADRFRRDRTLKVTLLIVIATILSARIGLYFLGDWFLPVLYVLIEIAGTLLIIQVWTLANEVFNTREAKRLFGIVGAGGVLSAVVVGLSVRGLVKIIGTENLLYFSMAALIIGLILVFKLSITCREELLSNLTESRRQVRTRIKLSSDWARFFANKQLVYVAGLVVMLGFVITLVDWNFKITVRNAFLNREDQLAGFLGMFWAITGAINCLIQFFLTSRILERFGILFSLLVLPFALIGGTTALLIIPALWSATALKGAEAVFRYTINDATFQLLYLPVPSHFRGRAKAFIDGIIRPIAIGLSGITLAWIIPGLAPNALGWILIALLLGWILFAIGARKQYYNSLHRTLQTRRLHFGEVSSMIPDEAAHKVLQQALDDPDEQNVLHALDMTRHSSNVDWSQDLVRLLTHKSAKVRARVLLLLCECGTLNDGPQVFTLLRDSNPVVRAAAVEAYCAIGKERAIRVISRFLSDSDAAVRAATVVGLIRYGGLDGVLSAAEKLKSMLESTSIEDREVGAEILGDIGVKNFYHPLLTLMIDDELSVRVSAIRAAGKMQSPELLPALVYRIEDPETRTVAAEALTAFGPPAVRLLSRVLSNPSENLATRQAVPGILARIGNQDAMDALLEHVGDPNDEMRNRTLESIHRLRLKKPHLLITREKIDSAIEFEIQSLYQQVFAASDLNLPGDSLLGEALKHRRNQTTRRIFRLLGCLHPVRTVDAVFTNLNAPIKRIQANAIELLDSMLDKETKRLLLPLLDEALIEDRLEVGQEIYNLVSKNQTERLATLMEEDNSWLSACAVLTAGKMDSKELLPGLMACAKSDFALVRETTLMVLRQMMPSENLQTMAEKHLNDPSANVRDYAGWILKGVQTS